MLNSNKELKLYYSIGEVAEMFDVKDSLLRYWEKKFPQLAPKKAGRGVRQYTKEDIETVRLIHYLVKERRMTLEGACHRMKYEREATLRNFEVVERLKNIREELVNMRNALDVFTYEQVDELQQKIAPAGSRRSQGNPPD